MASAGLLNEAGAEIIWQVHRNTHAQKCKPSQNSQEEKEEQRLRPKGTRRMTLQAIWTFNTGRGL